VIVSLGVSALGTTSYTPDRPLLLTGANVAPNAACTCNISFVSAATAATTLVNASYGILFSLSSSAAGVYGVKIPIEKGQVIYLAFSALGWAQLYFDEVTS